MWNRSLEENSSTITGIEETFLQDFAEILHAYFYIAGFKISNQMHYSMLPVLEWL